MHSHKIKTCLRYWVYIAEILILYALEQAPALTVPVFEIRPCLMICAFVMIALFEKEFIGALFGVFTGLLMDLAYGTPFGIYALLLFVLGSIVGVLSVYFMKINILSAFAVTCVVVFAAELLKFLTQTVAAGDDACFAWNRIYMIRGFYSCAVSVIIYMFNKSIAYYMRSDGGVENKNKAF